MCGRTFLKGMCVGVAVGAAIGMMMPMHKDQGTKTCVGKAIRNFGCAVDCAVDHAVDTARHMW